MDERKAPKRSINPRKNEDCEICGRLCHYKYYGVWSCESCKQFFRRVVIKKELYNCAYKQKCLLNGVDHCRSCRFDKCLLMGMQPELVTGMEEGHRHFLEFLKKHQKNMRQRHETIKSEMMSNPSDYRQFLNALMPLERAYKRIWNCSRPLPDAFFNRYDSIEELLDDNENFLTRLNKYMAEHPSPRECWNKADYLRELEEKGIMCPTNMEYMTKDWLICIEMAKSMPHFAKLQMPDKIILLKQIHAVMSLFMQAYYSHVNSAKTVTRSNGLTFISAMEVLKFLKDEKLASTGYFIFCHLVERMEAAGITYEEFLLLFAMITASSTADSLSPEGRELLYNESIRYSSALQKLLVAKFGHLAGIKKFSSIMGLVECAFKAKYNYDQFLVYYEVFYHRSDPSVMVPKALHFCFAL